MTKFIILNKADMMALCLNKPVDFCFDKTPGVLCTEDYYLKNVINQQDEVITRAEGEFIDKKEIVKNLAKDIMENNIPRCKTCKHFEYDSVANVDGIPLIVAHEICSRWGDGCKTKEDGYCFLWEDKDEQTN